MSTSVTYQILNTAKTDVNNASTKYKNAITSTNDPSWDGLAKKTFDQLLSTNNTFSLIIDNIEQYEIVLANYQSSMIAVNGYKEALEDSRSNNPLKVVPAKRVMKTYENEYNACIAKMTAAEQRIFTTTTFPDLRIFTLLASELIFTSDTIEKIEASLKQSATLLDNADSFLESFDENEYKKPLPLGGWPHEFTRATTNLSSLKMTIRRNIKNLSVKITRLVSILDIFKQNIENFENGQTIEIEIDEKEQAAEEETPVEQVPEIYTVQRGDSLSSIAAKYGITWNEIYEANKDAIGREPSAIEIGMQLIIPGITNEVEPAETKPEDGKEKLSASKLDDDIVNVEKLNGITEYDKVTESYWSIDCDDTDLCDLGVPLKGELLVNVVTDPKRNLEDYEYADQYTEGIGYYNQYKNYHQGADFSASNGTPVYSITAGVVVEKFNNWSAGSQISILSEVVDDNGNVSYYVTTYKHLTVDSEKRDNYCKVGDIVNVGDHVADSSNTGHTASGEPQAYHLHVEVCKTNLTKEQIAGKSPEEIARTYRNLPAADKMPYHNYVNIGSYYIATGKGKNNGNNVIKN